MRCITSQIRFSLFQAWILLLAAQLIPRLLVLLTTQSKYASCISSEMEIVGCLRLNYCANTTAKLRAHRLFTGLSLQMRPIYEIAGRSSCVIRCTLR